MRYRYKLKVKIHPPEYTQASYKTEDAAMKALKNRKAIMDKYFGEGNYTAWVEKDG